MSDTSYLKCSCQICGGSIEYPSEGLGQTIDCPHCSGQTKLVINEEKSTPKPRLKFVFLAGLILLVMVLAVAGIMVYLGKTSQTLSHPSANTATPVKTNIVIPKAFTELNEFQISKITLKKTQGSGLVYAVGTVRNDTSRQRFGVKIELDLLDSQDNKIGDASDYISVIEPHKEWQFKALLTEPKTEKAKLKDIVEQK